MPQTALNYHAVKVFTINIKILTNSRNVYFQTYGWASTLLGGYPIYINARSAFQDLLLCATLRSEKVKKRSYLFKQE